MENLRKAPAAPVSAQSRNGSGPAGAPLSHEELAAAELGFRQLLRRKRFPAAFLSRHAADLLAQARLEYVRHFANGDDDEIDNAAGWIIHCAWRRTQNLLERESRASRATSTNNAGALGVEATTPEDDVLEADRHRKVQEAIVQLPLQERKVIALTYFEGMSVREASRTLGWDKCKGDRRHNSALARLHELLGVTDADALQIEIGAAAWASLATGKSVGLRLPTALHAALDTATRAALELIGRGQELARGVLGGGATNGGIGAAAGARTAELGGGGVLAACTAGVCGAAAVTCLATGVLGPGLGGIDVVAHSQPERPAAQREAALPSPALPSPSLLRAARRSHSSAANRRKSTRPSKRRFPAKLGGAGRPAGAERVANTPASTPTTSPQQIEEEFDPFAEGGEPSPESSPASSRPTLSGSSDAEGPPAPAKQVEAEFGF